MPKAAIYAPIMHGGLGLKHLKSEQGIQQVNQVLKHLHSNTTLGTLFHTTIQAHQIHAGISNTRVHPGPSMAPQQVAHALMEILAFNQQLHPPHRNLDHSDHLAE